MEQNKQILNILTEKIEYLLGKNDIEAYNKLYDGLFYHITLCVNNEGITNDYFDLCITFLTLLKKSINDVLFQNE